MYLLACNTENFRLRRAEINFTYISSYLKLFSSYFENPKKNTAMEEAAAQMDVDVFNPDTVSDRNDAQTECHSTKSKRVIKFSFLDTLRDTV